MYIYIILYMTYITIDFKYKILIFKINDITYIVIYVFFFFKGVWTSSSNLV